MSDKPVAYRYWNEYNKCFFFCDSPEPVDGSVYEPLYIRPQPKQEQDEPVFHLKQYGDVTKEQLDCYIATGRIDTCPQHREWKDLTGEELETLLRENRSLTLGAIWAVADKLKEKNNG